MKIQRSFFLFLSLATTTWLFAENNENSTGNCWEKPEIIQPQKNDQFNQYIQSLKNNGGPPVPYNAPGKVYIADINNDGVKEYTLEEYEGSGHFLYIWPYEKKGETFEQIDIPRPDYIQHDGEWAMNGSRGYGLFIRVCGKTYLDFDLGSFIWENGKTVPACDENWMKYSHSRFQKLYDKGKFRDAYNYLSQDFKNCKQWASSRQELWYRNDLALAAFHVGDNDLCMANIQAIKADPEFKNAPEDLRKSVSFNEQKCQERINHPQTLEGRNFREVCESLNDLPEKKRYTVELIKESMGAKNCDEAGSKAGTLKELKLVYPREELEDIEPILLLPKLESLWIEDHFPYKIMTKITVKDWAPLTKVNLTSLHLENFNQGMDQTLSGLKFPNSLKKLFLGFSYPDNSTNVTFDLKSISNLVLLEDLTLAPRSVGKVNLDGVEEFKRLKKLELVFSNSAPESWESIERLSQVKLLGELGLTGLDERHVSLLPILENLTTLRLKTTYFEPDVTPPLVTWMKTQPKLETVIIEGEREDAKTIGDSTIASLRSLPHLKKLLVMGVDRTRP